MDTATSIKAPVSTIAAVANEFLNLGATNPNTPPIDQMKLQKLLFYANAWHLALNDAPLFEDDFEAWPWGPVARSVYSQTCGYGRNPVSGRICEIKVGNNGSLDIEFVTPSGVESHDLKSFIQQVWEVHKQYTGIQLSNSTHAPGEPWTIVRDQYGDLSCKPKIPNELIRAVFKGKIK